MIPVEASETPFGGLFEAAREAAASLAEELQCLLDRATDSVLEGIDGAEALSQSAAVKIDAIRTNLVHAGDKFRRHLSANSGDLPHAASSLGGGSPVQATSLPN